MLERRWLRAIVVVRPAFLVAKAEAPLRQIIAALAGTVEQSECRPLLTIRRVNAV
jgi:hypothetical protein